MHKLVYRAVMREKPVLLHNKLTKITNAPDCTEFRAFKLKINTNSKVYTNKNWLTFNKDINCVPIKKTESKRYAN